MNPRQTAMIFIEFQNDFCKEGGKLFSLVQEELKRNQTILHAVRLLEGARAKGFKVIHCPFTLDQKWNSENEVVGLLRGVSDGSVFEPNSWGHTIIDEMKPQEGEIVLEGKRTLSGFSHTNLEHLLKNAGIKNVFIAGFLTNICVTATALSAYDLGYHVRIVPEACAAASREIQEYVELHLCPIFGGAVKVEQVLEG